ncbi:MAG: EamA family transporter, partial [Burkholderiales bacterium]
MGEIAALISAVTWACTSVLLTTLTARTPPVVISALRLSAACFVLPFILLASGQASGIGDASAWTIFSVIASGVVGYGLGDTVYIHVLGMIGLQRAFPISMALFISLTVIGGIVLLGEPFKWGLPAGALLIAAGVYLIVIPGRGARGEPTPVIAVAEPALAAFPAFEAGGAAVATLPAATATSVSPAIVAAPNVLLAYGLLVLVGLLWA